MRDLCLVACCLLCAATTGRAAEPPPPRPTLPQLLGSFAKAPGFEAAFHEEKHLGLLAAPLRSSGRLYYRQGGWMARRTAEPAWSVVLIEPGRVSFADERGVQAYDLRSHAPIRQLVDGFVSVLGGQTKTLEALYHLDFQPTDRPGGWRLVLRPKKGPLVKAVARVVLAGRGLVVDELVVVEADGDRTVTRFSAPDHRRRFSEEEARRIFSVRPWQGSEPRGRTQP